MSKKRKDPKGNVLNKYEIYRKKDGLYEYRHPNYPSVYDTTLSGLREKEREIEDKDKQGIDYKKAKILLVDLLEKYQQYNKRTLREQTNNWYDYLLTNHTNDKIFTTQIGDIKTSDIKDYFIQLSEDGYAYNTLTKLKSLFKRAFAMAVEDDILAKNPCDFALHNFVVNKQKEKYSLTTEQQQMWLEFIQQDDFYSDYYDHYVILLGTGLRISEFCGLTEKDIDWENHLINVNHQLLFVNGKYKIEKTKTQKGMRTIPMTNEVYEAFRRVLSNRPRPITEMLIDGYSKFLFINKDGKPETKDSMGKRTTRICKKFNKLHEEQLPNITPHIFRHTYASNLAHQNINPDILKFLMGHSKSQVTFDVYTHTNLEDVLKELQLKHIIA